MRTPPPEPQHAALPPTYQRGYLPVGGHEEPAWMREDAAAVLDPMAMAGASALPPTAGSSVHGETTPLRGTKGDVDVLWMVCEREG